MSFGLSGLFRVAVALASWILVALPPPGAFAQLYPVNGQIPLSGRCTQSPNQLYMTGSFNKLAIALEYSALAMQHDLGSYDLCSMAPASHYCTTYFNVMCVRNDGREEVIADGNACNSGPVLGMCVPESCTGADLSQQVENFTRHSDIFQFVFGYGPLYWPLCVEVPNYCTNQSYEFMTADCLDEKKSFTSDSSAVAVFAVIVALCAMSIVCSLAGMYRRWSQSSVTFTSDEARQPLLGSVVVNHIQENELAVVPSQSTTRIQPKLWEIVGWFDLVENTREFFTVKARNVGSVDTRFFEGVRTIAMIFIFFGHIFSSLMNFSSPRDMVAYVESYASIGIFPSELAVDTFFYLSGFLMFHLYLKYSEKRAVNGELQHPPISHIPMMYLRRYLRMTPVVMLTMVFAVWLSVYIPSGVLHRTYENQPVFQTCKQDWWHQILYITNMHDAAGWSQCMGWFWYLSTDFQLFLAAPLLVVPYFFSRAGFLAFMAAGIIVITVFQTQMQYASYLGDNGSFYDKPWMRANPYLFGMACAALVRNSNVKGWFSSMSTRWISYCVGTVLMVTCINVMWRGLKCYEQSQTTGAMDCTTQYFQFMNSYAVSAWGLGMSCVALPWALSSEVGPIKWFLSTKPFAIASKLTFCCYMLHPIIIMIMMAEEAQYPPFTALLQYSRLAAVTLLTFFAASLLHLIVEVPFAKMNDALTRVS